MTDEEKIKEKVCAEMRNLQCKDCKHFRPLQPEKPYGFCFLSELALYSVSHCDYVPLSYDKDDISYNMHEQGSFLFKEELEELVTELSKRYDCISCKDGEVFSVIDDAICDISNMIESITNLEFCLQDETEIVTLKRNDFLARKACIDKIICCENYKILMSCLFRIYDALKTYKYQCTEEYPSILYKETYCSRKKQWRKLPISIKYEKDGSLFIKNRLKMMPRFKLFVIYADDALSELFTIEASQRKFVSFAVINTVTELFKIAMHSANAIMSCMKIMRSNFDELGIRDVELSKCPHITALQEIKVPKLPHIFAVLNMKRED